MENSLAVGSGMKFIVPKNKRETVVSGTSVEVVPLLVALPRIAAAFLAGWVVAIVVENDVSVCGLKVRTFLMDVYALVYPRMVICFLLLSPL